MTEATSPQLRVPATAEQRIAVLQGELDSLSGQLSDTYEELTLIYQISSGMRVNRSVEDFFLQACTDMIDVMGVRAAGYAVADASGRVETSAIFGSLALDTHAVAELQADLLRQFHDSARVVLNNDLGNHAAFGCLAGKAGQIVAVPIQRQDKVLGVLFCLDKLEADFTTQDSKLLTSIANETAIYLENSSLFSDARGMMMGLMHALTSAVDAKDTYTCGHSQRVALFGREIATRAGLSESQVERIYMAGLLHDVGKIGVSEEVLRKPGKLTDEEFTQMKQHVEIGARILKDVRQIDDLIPGVLYHHERYDGKGYPHNLAAQDIPLVARILCVADCFDAMTSNRTYRKALPIEVALMEIRRCAGTQFDPLLADAFLSIGATRLRELIGTVTDHMALQLAA
jgi:HD-GYP domain-containing protein (c-di-GMP phosphodiesterase class II)